MELSTREACVLLDGDLQDPPELIEDFVEKWREGYEVVYGRRVKREMGWLQGSMYRAFYWILSSISSIPIPRDAGDFSLMDRMVVRWVLGCEERDSFLRGLRAFVGFRQTGIDYVRPKRPFGQSTNNWLANFGWARKAIFSFSSVPLELFTFSGIGLFGATMLLAATVFILKILAPHFSPPGVTTLLLGVMFFGSINLLGIAMLGEYIGKIMHEVKRRPPFIRRHVIAGGRFHDPPDDSLERRWSDDAV
jgi:dolichol-phosphate mannosyltransferase